jgi:protein TonB
LLVHVSLVILVALLLAARAARLDATPLTHQRVSLQMPAMLSLMPAVVAPPPKGNAVEPPTPAPAMSHPAPQAAATLGSPAAGPLEMPSGVDAEPAMHDDAAIDDAAVGTEAGGETNGVARGDASAGGGPAVEAAPPPAATGPYQIGDGIDRPRKIKDVKPVYPLPAMAAQVGGAVYIEATIGADGKVRDARVLRSVAILEQAALDAVRQWEYEPSRRNGVAVAVTMVVVVTFALL